VLDAGTGALRWAVSDPPIGIYPYAAALVAADAAALRNCLNTLAPNSLCIYAQPSDQLAPVVNQSDPGVVASRDGSASAPAGRAVGASLTSAAAVPGKLAAALAWLGAAASAAALLLL
jgi:hypothetical protein